MITLKEQQTWLVNNHGYFSEGETYDFGNC